MAAKSDVPGSMMEGLQALLPDIASCMAAPDADMQFLDKLQKVVLLRIHQPPPKPQGAGAAGAPSGGPGAGGPGGLPGSPDAGGGAPNPAMPGGGAPEAPTQPGGVSKPMTPDPDQMRRVLAEQASA